jgi:hypothetical protein
MYKNNTAFDGKGQEKSWLEYAMEVISKRVSVFSGLKNANPVGFKTLAEILESIKNGKFSEPMARAREALANGDEDLYDAIKDDLAAFTPSCQVKYRGLKVIKTNPKSGPHNLISLSGAMVADIDGEAIEGRDLNSLRVTIESDAYVLFCFASPSNQGLKVGHWSPNINTIEDHENFYFSVERYFKEKYDVAIDRKCKDPARLCCVSDDSLLFLNPEAAPFPVEEYAPKEKPKQEAPPNDGPGPNNAYGRKAMEDECRKVSESPEGGHNRNNTLNKAALKLGHYVGGGILTYADVEEALLRAALACGLLESDARATIRSGLAAGIQEPRTPPPRDKFSSSHGKERTEPPKADEWETPIPLGMPRPAPMPENLLPGPVGEMVKAVSLFTETPYELGAGLSLVAVACCVAGKYEVEIKPGYTEPINIWIMPALETGNRKSAVVNLIFQPHIEWEQAELEALLPEKRRIKLKNDAIETRIKKINTDYAKGKDRFARESLLREMEAAEEEKEPELIPPQVFCDDVTPENLGTIMAEHGGIMALVSDEGGIFDNFAGRYSKNGDPNLDLLLKGHSGMFVRVNRGSRPPVDIPKPAISVGISPQPVTLKKLWQIPTFRARGGMARIGFLMPESLVGYRSGDGPGIPARVKAAYHAFIRNLLDNRNIGKKITDIFGTDTPEKKTEIQRIQLAPEARQEWNEFDAHIEPSMRPGGKHENIKDWCSKLPGFAGRLSGTVHTMGGGGPEISLETMERALELAGVFLEHALYVFDLIGEDDSLAVARRIMAWVERKGLSEFKKRDCFNSMFKFLIGRKVVAESGNTLRFQLCQNRHRNIVRPATTLVF